jgi:hypothetical protein
MPVQSCVIGTGSKNLTFTACGLYLFNAWFNQIIHVRSKSNLKMNTVNLKAMQDLIHSLYRYSREAKRPI